MPRTNHYRVISLYRQNSAPVTAFARVCTDEWPPKIGSAPAFSKYNVHLNGDQLSNYCITNRIAVLLYPKYYAFHSEVAPQLIDS